MYGYNQQMNIDRINNQIQELEKIKHQYQNPPQPPINIYNGSMPTTDFKAHILNEDEKPEEILINTRTMFFDDKKGHLYIKELNGDIKEYKVELPLDEKDKKILELERKLKQYEYANVNEPSKSNEKNGKPNKVNDNGTTKNI